MFCAQFHLMNPPHKVLQALAFDSSLYICDLQIIILPMPKSFVSSITDTVTLLLNTPIVPSLPRQRNDVALTELPHPSPRRHTEALQVERSRSADLAAGDIRLERRLSEESRRTNTQSHGNSDQSSRDGVPTTAMVVLPVMSHRLSRRASYMQELEPDLH